MTDRPQEPEPRTPSNVAPAYVDLATPKGIGGWLALFVIGLVASVVILLIRLPDAVGTLRGGIWASAAGVPLLRPLLVFETIGHITILGGAVGSLVFIWRRHPSTPRFIELYLLWVLAYSIGELGMVPGVFARMIALVHARGGSTTALQQGRLDAISESGRTALAALVWLLYWLKSRRVANTFGRPGGDAATEE